MRIYIDGVLLGGAFGMCCILMLLATLGTASPRAGLPVLIVAPPWSDAVQAVLKAGGGRPVGPVSAPFAVLAVFETANFGDLSKIDGIWALRDASVLAGLCGGML